MIITQLWRQQSGDFFCLSTKSASGKWKDTFFKRTSLEDVDGFIKSNSDKDIYFCPHGFTKPRRLKACAATTTLLWADLDGADPRKLGSLRPTVAIESSPGRFVGLWICKSETTEELNHGLTEKIEADPGGWDLTQVLRVPGTTNYKYVGKPTVRLLWSNGPVYDVKVMSKLAPPIEDDEEAEDGGGGSAATVFKEYEKKLPAWVRRELIGGKPRHGSRSDMIWKLEHTLLECGLTSEEAFLLIRASPWNKFKGRDAQLRKELDKAVKEHLRGVAYVKPAGGWLTTSLEDIELKANDWLWYPYLARGEITILEGDPSVGKSYLAQIVSGALCDGRKLPSTRPRSVVGKVAYFDVENSGGTVTKARALDNHIVNLRNFLKEDRLFSIDNDEDVAEVYDAIERVKPALVVFDTLLHYTGAADTHKASETTQAMAFFKELAVRFHCAVLVLRHLTKGNGGKALYRGQGSIAFAGVARIILTLGRDKDDRDTRILAMTKNNITKEAVSRAFFITELPATLKRDDRSKFEWGDWREDVTADDLVSDEGPKTGGQVLEGAIEFLKDRLGDEAVEVSVLLRMAETQSITKTMLYRAADKLGVVKTGKGFGKDKTSVWALK